MRARAMSRQLILLVVSRLCYGHGSGEAEDAEPRLCISRPSLIVSRGTRVEHEVYSDIQNAD